MTRRDQSHRIMRIFLAALDQDLQFILHCVDGMAAESNRQRSSLFGSRGDQTVARNQFVLSQSLTLLNPARRRLPLYILEARAQRERMSIRPHDGAAFTSAERLPLSGPAAVKFAPEPFRSDWSGWR
jgi:hypothetical protein